jgi:hypothetical protein
MADKNKVYTISPSDLTYICYHCAYLKKNYSIYNSGISAGITSTLDGIEKKYFLGDCKKISQNLSDGEVIDPYNINFFSKELLDNKQRPFRLKGKCDAIIKFLDGNAGIVDFKTSKFKREENKKTDKFSDEDLKSKVDEYSPQLHAYSLLYSNLETDKDFLAEQSTAKEAEKKMISVKKKLEKIKNVSVEEAKTLGIVFIYPDGVIESNRLGVYFSYQYEPLKVDMKNFKDLITNYLDVLYKKEPPPIPESCGTKAGKSMKKCLSHSFFYDVKKLRDLDKVN